MNKKVSVSMVVTVAILAMTVTFSITMIMAMRLFDSTVASVKEKESMYSKIAEIDKYVRSGDYYAIDENTLYDTIASGYMLGTGDKYAKYYTAAAYSELIDTQNGKLMGIGVELAKDSSGYAKVLKVYAGSPAEDLGITRGCYITAVGDIDVKTLSSADAVQTKLRGEAGTTVSLKWLNTVAEEQTDEITRRSYKTTTVDYELRTGGYGYIKIRLFDDTTPSELDYAVNTMTAAGATSLIIDLRDNAGGILEDALRCIDLLCPESVTASAVYKDGTTAELGSSDDETKTALPIVCVVNGNTASAAELFAADVSLLNGAKLVGTNTAGKGTIQSSPQRLSDGSAVVITVASLVCADGSSFDGTGLTVGTERALTADEETMYYDFTLDNDPQLQRAFAVADNLTDSSTVGATNGASSSAASEEPAADGETEGEGQTAASEGGAEAGSPDEPLVPAEEDSAASAAQ